MSNIHYASIFGFVVLSILLTLFLNNEAFGRECKPDYVEETRFVQDNPNAKTIFVFKREDELMFNQVIDIMEYATRTEFKIDTDKITFYEIGDREYTFSLHVENCVSLWGSIHPDFFEKLFGIEI